MKDKLIWHLIPILLRLPLPQKVKSHLATKLLVKIVVESVTNYYEVRKSLETNELRDNPLWVTAHSLAAMLALMPIAMIYGYAKDSQKRTK